MRLYAEVRERSSALPCVWPRSGCTVRAPLFVAAAFQAAVLGGNAGQEALTLSFACGERVCKLLARACFVTEGLLLGALVVACRLTQRQTIALAS